MVEAASKERTHNYLRQIKGAVIYRAVGMAASFLAIPLMIHYLGQEQFGVWSTLLTVMSWIVFFDLGVGNGLRNKVAESLARGESREARSYISSGYTLVGLIALSLWILLNVGSYFVSWQVIFNTEVIQESTLRETFQIAVFFIILNFWVGLIAAILGAIQKTSLVGLGQLISNLMVLIFVFYLTKTSEASISNLAFIYGISLVTANILLSLWFYKTWPELRPRLSFERRHVRPLLTIGLQFFIIQLAVLVIFTTDKILITQVFGPEYVTQYEVVFKLFSVITFAHGLISAPLWSAYTDAYHKRDLPWIRRMLRKQLKIVAGIVLVVLMLGVLARLIIGVWIGKDFTVSMSLIIVMGIFVLISTWNNVFAVFVNGIGKIKLQLCTAIVAMLVNIPLSIFFAKYTTLGISGIVVGTICSLLLAAVALPLQAHRIVGKAKAGHPA